MNYYSFKISGLLLLQWYWWWKLDMRERDNIALEFQNTSSTRLFLKWLFILNQMWRKYFTWLNTTKVMVLGMGFRMWKHILFAILNYSIIREWFVNRCWTTYRASSLHSHTVPPCFRCLNKTYNSGTLRGVDVG